MSDICNPVRRSNPLKLPAGRATMSMIADGLLEYVQVVTATGGSTWFECAEASPGPALEKPDSNWLDDPADCDL